MSNFKAVSCAFQDPCAHAVSSPLELRMKIFCRKSHDFRRGSVKNLAEYLLHCGLSLGYQQVTLYIPLALQSNAALGLHQNLLLNTQGFLQHPWQLRPLVDISPFISFYVIPDIIQSSF